MKIDCAVNGLTGYGVFPANLSTKKYILFCYVTTALPCLGNSLIIVLLNLLRIF
jgi:hypothetical protein